MMAVKLRSPKEIRPDQKLLCLKIRAGFPVEIRGIDSVIKVDSEQYFYNPIHSPNKEFNFSFKSIESYNLALFELTAFTNDDEVSKWFEQFSSNYKVLGQFMEDLATICDIDYAQFKKIVDGLLCEPYSFLAFMKFFTNNFDTIHEHHFYNEERNVDTTKVKAQFELLFNA